MPRYYVHTLGCKLNQFDSALAEGVLRGGAYEPTDDPSGADVIVLNTCTVTSRADAEGRRLARLFRRVAPSARIVATGCYAERDPEALLETGAVDGVVGLRERDRLPQTLLGKQECATAPVGLFFADRARAYLRVQEGCDLRCSYCIIPSVRGPSRSVPVNDAVAQARLLAERGVREIGLTGVNTGSWGRDLAPPRAFADLLEALLAGTPGAVRFRLNSLEPRTVSRHVLDLIAARPERLVPHIQIPLQSGSDRVLARMSRNYRTSFYRTVIEKAAARVPGICLGADVITGFPGETDEDHAATRSLLAALPLGYLHVFSYSARPGTRAAELDATSAVRPDVIRARTNDLRTLGARLGRAFRERLLGSTAGALVLDAPARDGARRALTGNYVEVRIPAGAAAPGSIVCVRLADLLPDGRTVRAEVLA